ncbi:MAG: hypothetical protein L6Q68_02350 [Aquabacterium sp.]|nr:hypothetical protein [Aquabacterium sp.]
MLARLSDLQSAFDEGRWHMQRVYKAAGTAHALQWADASFAAGQPAYDARVGAAATFTPSIAAKNDAVYFPPIAPGMERRLTSVTLMASQATFNGPASVVIFDLLGYYPLIDGDSTDTQVMDNTLTLPRYADGVGVFPVMVCHVAPAVQNGVAIVGYTDSTGAARSATLNVPNNGQNLVCSGVRSAAATDVGPLYMALADNCQGVRSIDSLTYTTPPGGLHCIYLVKPLATMRLGDNAVAAEKEFISKAACHCPQVLDGAWLGWFDRIGAGTSRTVAWFGNFTFAWG